MATLNRKVLVCGACTARLLSFDDLPSDIGFTYEPHETPPKLFMFFIGDSPAREQGINTSMFQFMEPSFRRTEKWTQDGNEYHKISCRNCSGNIGCLRLKYNIRHGIFATMKFEGMNDSARVEDERGSQDN